MRDGHFDFLIKRKMSNAVEKVEELVDECLDEGTVAFVELMESFGLTVTTINVLLGKLKVRMFCIL